MPEEIQTISAEKHYTGPERRSGVDRRNVRKPIFSSYRLSGKRSRPRRQADRQKAYFLDRYSYRTFLVILAIVLLSIFDAALTLHLISHGAAELNPAMAYFLRHGPTAFFIAKYALTAFSIVVILIYGNNFLFGTRLRVKLLFLAALAPFSLVVLWEIFLLLTIP
jgi:hypothetical protein